LKETPISRPTVFYWVRKYATAIGLKVNRMDERGICVHSMRVTAITTAFKGGATLEEIQQLVGHSDPRNTLRYRRSTPEDAKRAAMRINY